MAKLRTNFVWIGRLRVFGFLAQHCGARRARGFHRTNCLCKSSLGRPPSSCLRRHASVRCASLCGATLVLRHVPARFSANRTQFQNFGKKVIEKDEPMQSYVDPAVAYSRASMRCDCCYSTATHGSMRIVASADSSQRCVCAFIMVV